VVLVRDEGPEHLVHTDVGGRGHEAWEGRGTGEGGGEKRSGMRYIEGGQELRIRSYGIKFR
jgi:hypothetical protein